MEISVLLVSSILHWKEIIVTIKIIFASLCSGGTMHGLVLSPGPDISCIADVDTEHGCSLTHPSKSPQWELGAWPCDFDLVNPFFQF